MNVELGAGSDLENVLIDVLGEVKIPFQIPAAVKLNPFHGNMANTAKRLDTAGLAGLVLFNRFYQPDVDLNESKIRPACFSGLRRSCACR